MSAFFFPFYILDITFTFPSTLRAFLLFFRDCSHVITL